MLSSLTLAFIHAGKAFLPELEGYQAYFSGIGIKTLVLHPNEMAQQHIDIEWHMMGAHFRRTHKTALVIHEYASPSTPPLAAIKNKLKNLLNCRPDYRLFLNEATAAEMNFKDDTPFGYRDMFITSKPERMRQQMPIYDFIYAGSVEAGRQPKKLLNVFATGSMKTNSLLILSQNYSALQKAYRQFDNIHFTGPVKPADVGQFIRQARFGIDYRPLVKPYDIQTSSKLLEYSAQGVPVISSGTQWVLGFMQAHGGRFFLLNKDLSNFNMAELERFSFEFPQLNDFSLPNQLAKSGILEFLRKKTGASVFTSLPVMRGLP